MPQADDLYKVIGEQIDALEASNEPMAANEPTDTAVDAPATETPAPAEPEAKTPHEGRDEKGRFAPKAKVQETPQAAGQPSPDSAPPPPGPAAAAPAPTPELKAPQSWKAGIREKWATLPAEVQQEVNRRERETTIALQEASEARKGWQTFRETVAPFEAMIRAEKTEPMQAVANLLQTAAALRTAPPVHKAALIANMVKTFGVPIEALDQALAGQTPAANQPMQGEYRDPRVDQLLAQLQGAQQQREQELHAKMASELQAFQEKSEFFEDVRNDMATLMRAAELDKRDLSLEQAYNAAIQMFHPDIAEILRQREAAKAATNAQASTARAKAASSSVRPSPATPVIPASRKMSDHEAVAAAIDALGIR